EFDIIFGKGICRTGEVLDMAVELDIVKKSGAWFSYDGNKLGQGRDNAKKVLEDNPELMKEIEDKIAENKDALMAVTAKSSKKKSKLEEAAEAAAEGNEDIGDIGEMGDMDDIDPVVNAEDDFEEFTPAD
ncbi:MAG: DNA recombination/repair protein RecA, partial [Oscillospiraceae bacterium]|nr:DNA recombination/repair protein RecA [Oscillospiraceae bacterium]